MESISATENKTAGQTIVEAPLNVATAVAEKTETVGHEVKAATVETVTVVVDATRIAVGEAVAVAKQMGRDVQSAVTPTPEVVATPASPVVDSTAE